MREIVGDGVQWHVHEASATHVPGARRDRCLIFDSDGIVRRIWTYPDDWMSLNDDALWALVNIARVPLGNRSPAGAPPRRLSPPGQPSVIAAAAELARARAIAAELALMSAESRREDFEAATNRCRELRETLRMAIKAYALTLRRNGVPPERAVVLMKAAMRDGLGASGACEDLDEDEILDEGVAWGIQSYYAA